MTNTTTTALLGGPGEQTHREAEQRFLFSDELELVRSQVEVSCATEAADFEMFNHYRSAIALGNSAAILLRSGHAGPNAARYGVLRERFFFDQSLPSALDLFRAEFPFPIAEVSQHLPYQWAAWAPVLYGGGTLAFCFIYGYLFGTTLSDRSFSQVFN